MRKVNVKVNYELFHCGPVLNDPRTDTGPRTRNCILYIYTGALEFRLILLQKPFLQQQCSLFFVLHSVIVHCSVLPEVRGGAGVNPSSH